MTIGYTIIDSETQYDDVLGNSKDYLFETYGITRTGRYLKRDLEDLDKVIIFVGDGIREREYYDERGMSFFRINYPGQTHYRQYDKTDDYEFNEKDSLTNEEIIKTLKKYIYLSNPKLSGSTLIGGGRKGILGNPNWMYGTYILEDGNEYTVIKRFGTVKIFKGRKNKYAYSEKDEQAICSFDLEEDMYQKALDFMIIKRSISDTLFGKYKPENVEKMQNLYKEITDYLKDL